jgi:hypothetical protein
MGPRSDIKEQDRLIIGLGLAWAASTYMKLGEWTWVKDWASLAFFPTVTAIIHYVTPQARQQFTEQDSYVSHTNQERIRFVLQTAARVAQVCVFYKLACERNGSLSLKPYLYYGATVTLVDAVFTRYAKNWFITEVEGLVGKEKTTTGFILIRAALLLRLLSTIQQASEFAKYATGEAVQVSKTWVALSFVGVELAHRYIVPKK